MKLLVGNPGPPDGQTEDSFEFMDLTNQKTNNFENDFVRLYNLTSDPYENENLAISHPDVVDDLMGRLSKYVESMIAPQKTDEIAAGNPNENGGFYGPGWCQSLP